MLVPVIETLVSAIDHIKYGNTVISLSLRWYSYICLAITPKIKIQKSLKLI